MKHKLRENKSNIRIIIGKAIKKNERVIKLGEEEKNAKKMKVNGNERKEQKDY